LRTLNPEELKKVNGAVFGRIYEYFLTRFADQKAHDGGEFFTPISIVSLIAHVLDPERGTVLDPACGSGGMFVQSARIVEEHGDSPTEKLTFCGLEKNATTIRLAKMNLAVHGLEGDIQQAITYYEDPHELVGKADYVMANPPFNVNEIDADKVKRDPRLTFGLPGVNKKGKVSYGNYVWISYCYSYLSEQGRGGFVMPSQASSAGGSGAKVRQQLVKTGDVDVMVAIRSNFFYTSSVPCELWFLNRAKPEEHRNKVLMLDARNIFCKVTPKFYNFSPEQEKNLLAIVWLYRGRTDKYLATVAGYCRQALEKAAGCFEAENESGESEQPLPDFTAALLDLLSLMVPFLKTLDQDGPHTVAVQELNEAFSVFEKNLARFQKDLAAQQAAWQKQKTSSGELNKTVERLCPLAEMGRDLIKQSDLLFKLTGRVSETCEKDCHAKQSDLWQGRDITRSRKALDEARSRAVEQLKQVRYFWKQAHWLTERFPEARLRDVAGLVKLVDIKEIETNDWSLTPGRYVGVASEEEDEDFDFEKALREIHVELENLNGEAVTLAARIKRNFEELGV
ncbi:MAG: SAM-dependent methyltransferase, partial [Desulfobulbaceae bacterium]|nr:SAM-dependent methyltransferase [Desulfobulbaceae bacterium]